LSVQRPALAIPFANLVFAVWVLVTLRTGGFAWLFASGGGILSSVVLNEFIRNPSDARETWGLHHFVTVSAAMQILAGFLFLARGTGLFAAGASVVLGLINFIAIRRLRAAA
jgi:hypothetical protein